MSTAYVKREGKLLFSCYYLSPSAYQQFIGLTATQHMIIHVLLGINQKGNYARITVKQLALKLEVDVANVRRALGPMEKKKLIQRVYTGRAMTGIKLSPHIAYNGLPTQYADALKDWKESMK
jgi:predicted transcriptional regulator